MSLDTMQASAFRKLSRLKAGALFMEMGTGKTKVALDLATSRQADFDTIIWIAPASLIAEPSYRAEVEKWRAKLYRPIQYYSVEGISASDRLYLEMRSLAESLRTFCIVDESITIKNTEAGRTARLLSIWSLFTFRLILNGTPASNGLIDLYSQIQFIHPHILNMTEAQFASHFLTYREEGWKPWKRWSKPANEQALIETIRPYIFDADLDLAVPVRHHDIDCSLSSEEAAAYGEFKRAFLEKNIGLDFLAVAQAFQSHYTLCRNKLDRLSALPKRKAIIYIKFLKEVDPIREIFPDALVYTGQRKDDLSLLNEDCDQLICTYGTGSMGLNLQVCNDVIFFSQTFDWKDKAHAVRRVARTGQISDVNVYDFWLNTGLDNIMRQSQAKKTSTASNLKRFIQQRGEHAL